MKHRTSLEIKKIESESWKKTEVDLDSLKSTDIYNLEWNEFLLQKSIKGSNLNQKDIINIGGGPGKEAEFLLNKGARKVLLVDIAPGQIETALIRKQKHGLTNLEAELGDAENLNHHDKKFDLAYIFMALHHFPDHKKSIDEACRTSKEVIFVDIMNSGLTNFLNRLGFFKTEWCGIEPNRLKEKEVKEILNENGMNIEIEYFFYPPYYGDNRYILSLIKTFSGIINYTLKLRPMACFFGNVAIIKGNPG